MGSGCSGRRCEGDRDYVWNAGMPPELRHADRLGARTAFTALPEMPRQLVNLSSCRQFHAFPISLHFALGTCQEVSSARPRSDSKATNWMNRAANAFRISLETGNCQESRSRHRNFKRRAWAGSSHNVGAQLRMFRTYQQFTFCPRNSLARGLVFGRRDAVVHVQALDSRPLVQLPDLAAIIVGQNPSVLRVPRTKGELLICPKHAE